MRHAPPSIEAEQMTESAAPGLDGRLAFHSFRFEVLGLPALDGEEARIEYAGEIMAAAVSKAGSAIQRVAEERAPNGLLAQAELDVLNADLQRMADHLADAVSVRTDASWWMANQVRFIEEQTYDVIVAGEGG